MSERSHTRASDDPIEILLVEDNPGDVRLVEEAFKAIDREITVRIVTNGYDAVHFLKRRSASGSPSLPDLALVDIQLPGKDGCEVLETIRDEPQMRRLPVIMLTSSKASSDVARCYDAQANAYVTKPADHDAFVSQMQVIVQFWFEQVRLPPLPQ